MFFQIWWPADALAQLGRDSYYYHYSLYFVYIFLSTAAMGSKLKLSFIPFFASESSSFSLSKYSYLVFLKFLAALSLFRISWILHSVACFLLPLLHGHRCVSSHKEATLKTSDKIADGWPWCFWKDNYPVQAQAWRGRTDSSYNRYLLVKSPALTLTNALFTKYDGS